MIWRRCRRVLIPFRVLTFFRLQRLDLAAIEAGDHVGFNTLPGIDLLQTQVLIRIIDGFRRPVVLIPFRVLTFFRPRRQKAHRPPLTSGAWF